MAEQVKVLAANTDDLNSITRPHTVEGQNWHPQVVLQPREMHALHKQAPKSFYLYIQWNMAQLCS